MRNISDRSAKSACERMARLNAEKETPMSLRITAIFVLVVTLFATTAFADVAANGGPSQAPGFGLWIHGIQNWESTTSSFLQAVVNPPFYQNGEGNIPFAYPLHSSDFTVGYWQLDGQKFSTQTLAHVNPVGDFLWEGHIEVGMNDTRPTQTFDWWFTNTSMDANLSWFAVMYNVDTRHRVFMTSAEPGSVNNSGSFTTATSRGGYDFMVAAWTPTAVPEPGNMLAMFTGLVGLTGFGIRRRRK